MAFLASITPIGLYFTFLLIGSQHKEVLANGLLDVLSGLYKKSVQNKQPVVVVLSKDLLQTEVKPLTPPTPLEDSDNDDLYNILHLTLDKHQLKKSRPQSKSLLPYKLKTPQKYRSQKDDVPYDLGLQTNKQVLRSPIVKSLLRISNSIQCEAQEDCKDLCGNKYNGKKRITCTIKCQVQFDCNPEKEEEYVDPCQDDQCKQDSCGGSNECGSGSTKGVTLVTEKPECTRC